MGFNYLQTDDRDDYLSQFNSRKDPNRNKVIGHTLIDPSGKELFSKVASHVIRLYFKRTYLTTGNGKRVWRTELQQRGYFVINNRERLPRNLTHAKTQEYIEREYSKAGYGKV